MAPSAIYGLDEPDGRALEAISDAVDEVNVLKAQASQRKAELDAEYDAESQFDAAKDKSQFRQYEAAQDRVRDFYREQHAKQTVAYNLAARNRFHSAARVRPELTVWEAMEKLDTLIDESDPDTSLGQIQHLLQSAEAIRRDGKPRWMQLTGLIHDLGKLMLFFDGAQGQWDVVGDTFPVGCRFDERNIYPEAFAANPDSADPAYSSELGVYSPGCGLDNVMMSWGHDEYLYRVVRDQSTLPPEALAMIRYHSFYSWHSGGAYTALMEERDWDMLKAVRAFNPYDLYSKSDDVPSVEELKPYYLELIDEFFPQKKIKW
ncbi:inositol oxygenase [Phialemonium atrogriseum]|uniref:Inositol oxygenase n=1 Tax=Phialemonium atrogriseum TaxID=1093897 RepID=A0AAJ0FIL0_9PEZI|nr:inositol oxygenase [Phialemonium atrogriseum]KAK1762210.1 inositol oxygenase [Phialemonium atrogriseum]